MFSRRAGFLSEKEFEVDKMSNRTMTDEQVMRNRWDGLLKDMEKDSLDCLLTHSTDRIYSSYLRYITDSPVSLYPMSGLFSKQGISLIGHGVPGVPLIPIPVEDQKSGAGRFHAGGVRLHPFVKDLIGVPACPTTNYAPEIWAEAIGELIRKYGYRRIGIVGMNLVPVGIVEYLKRTINNLEFVDASSLVDARKCVKSPYEIQQARDCASIIDEIMMAIPSVMKAGMTLRDVGKKLRSIADGLDCMDLNIMLGKHPTMPMFSEWIYTDDEVITKEDCVEIMVEVSSNVGFWGECARVFSLSEPSEELRKTVDFAFKAQTFAADRLIPGSVSSQIYRDYCDELVANGFPPEKRFFCHGQGYDVVEMPFIRPENDAPIQSGSVVAIHPSLYDMNKKVGCFVCDNFLITEKGTVRLNKVPREIIPVYNGTR